MLEAVVLLSFLSLVHCCPYVVEPSSLNVSQGTPAQFSVVVCGSSATLVVWAVDNVVYVNGYNFNGISVVQEALSGNRVRSNLTLATNSTELDNALIASTVYAPQAVPSDTVILRIQGLLDPVNDLNYDIINQRLSWSPPFTLSGVPISHYRIIIKSNNNNLPLFTTNSSLTTLYLNGTPCQGYNVIIRAVNPVGEGQSVSLNYTHVGVPVVDYTSYTGTINNDTFAIEVSYEISYNCTEQIPGKVHAVTRNMYGNSVMTHSNQSVNHDGMLLTGNVLSGSYSIDELLSDDAYVGQLVFETEQGLTVKTREFNLWTFDLNSVTITTNETEVCVNVSYTSGSEAIGFVIKTLTGQWNINRNHTNATCVPLTDGVRQVRVFDWNSDGSISQKWRKEINVTIALPHTSQSHSSTYSTPHISSTSTTTTSTVSIASTKYVVSSNVLHPTVTSTTNNTNPAAKDNAGVIVGVTVAVFLPITIALVVVILVLVIIWKRRKGTKYNASWRPSSWTDYNEPSEYPNTTEQPWTGVRLTEVVENPATESQANNATDSTALSERATGSYLTDCTVTEQDPPPYSSHYVVPHGNQSHFPTQRETTSNETLPSGKESHYADIQVGGKQAVNKKSHNKAQERVVYSKIKAPPYALHPSDMKPKGSHPRNLNIAVPFSRHSSGLPRQDQGYSSSNHQSSSDINTPHDYGAGAVTYLSASQQAQNNNDDSFSLVTSSPSHIDQLQPPAVSSTNSHSNYSKNTSSTTTVC